MATVVRIERKDYGGVQLWIDVDIHGPFYANPQLVSQFEAAIGMPVEDIDIANPPTQVINWLTARYAERVEGREFEAKLAVFDEVRGQVETAISNQLERARNYLIANPSTTLAQIRAAVLAKLQNLFTGDVY